MTRLMPVVDLFKQSEANVNGLVAYLNDMPLYRDAGQRSGSGPYALDLLSYTDGFEYQFRRYLAGRVRTLHNVFREIRTFQAFNQRHSYPLVAYSLAVVKETILLNEWYEIMPRYNQAFIRIQRKFHFEQNLADQGFNLAAIMYFSELNES